MRLDADLVGLQDAAVAFQNAPVAPVVPLVVVLRVRPGAIILPARRSAAGSLYDRGHGPSNPGPLDGSAARPVAPLGHGFSGERAEQRYRCRNDGDGRFGRAPDDQVRAVVCGSMVSRLIWAGGFSNR